ncbi:MAG: ABC-F family ATP-binding cassette domain-containing protein, partial [Syntrophomonas sp.]|nr:ABC-F family ATP-binding cassette domain-containing protein [Syntrophomonas sp.]
MNLLVMDNVSKAYGDKQIMQNIFLSIEEGDKIGVLGINGSGKSSLLKLIVGWDEVDQGSIIKNKHLQINYLPQNPEFEPDATVISAVLNNAADIDQMDTWSQESDAQSILTRLGINQFDARLDQLSGGQRKRVALAAALMSPADLLILDEPTNHLDNQAIDWLEKYLQRFKGALLMVTHDRYFLERVTNRIIEIENSQLFSYPGNWSVYLERKLERQASEAATTSKKESLLRQELAWMRKGAKARSTKQKARIERFENLQEDLQTTSRKNMKISSAASRLGKKTIILQAISHSYRDEMLIKDYSYILARNDRLGIVGPNGIGKSTLLRIMSGELSPNEGSVEIGSTIKIGFFPQESIGLPDEMRVIDYIREAGEFLSTGKRLLSASQMLETFLFPPSSQWNTLQKLSGGEKRRLHLLRILMAAPNVLLLDEPGNDLDIETLSILEHYLDDFCGAVVAVSHDRHFLDRMADKIVSFEGEGQLEEYPGNYSDYLLQSAKKSSVKPRKPAQPSIDKTNTPHEGAKPKILKFSFKEQKEFEEIDDKIAALEDEIKALNTRINQAASDYQLLQTLVDARQELVQLHEQLLDRWAYLNELAEAIEGQAPSYCK